jgi:hypothetical protein
VSEKRQLTASDEDIFDRLEAVRIYTSSGLCYAGLTCRSVPGGTTVELLFMLWVRNNASLYTKRPN